MMKKSVAMLAVCMLAQSHLAIAAGTPAPQEINIVFTGHQRRAFFAQYSQTTASDGAHYRR
ncbi:Ribonuclease Z [Salmonella enterica subsp. enterica serovar Daytona]|uniref:Ribonuclease Z n=1 Tax=Salmonella enterica subsp. enterica serovar Daytona TaxID=1962639 RepID=A0A447JJW3_SALET|nr:Ribonuclease Z [Salmonella enterica subsp. enterica serovar Daytona]